MHRGVQTLLGVVNSIVGGGQIVMKPGELCPGVGNAHACIARLAAAASAARRSATRASADCNSWNARAAPASLFLMRPSASSIPACVAQRVGRVAVTLCRGNSLFKRAQPKAGVGRIFVGMAHGGTGSGQGGVAFGHLPAELCDTAS